MVYPASSSCQCQFQKSCFYWPAARPYMAFNSSSIDNNGSRVYSPCHNGTHVTLLFIVPLHHTKACRLLRTQKAGVVCDTATQGHPEELCWGSGKDKNPKNLKNWKQEVGLLPCGEGGWMGGVRLFSSDHSFSHDPLPQLPEAPRSAGTWLSASRPAPIFWNVTD